MMKKFVLTALAIVAMATLAVNARAAVTYVDASMANTDIVGGGADILWLDGDDGTTGGTVTDGSASNDGLWRFRAGFGDGGIFEATGSSTTAEDCVEIVTSVAVADGLYNVYVFQTMVNTTDHRMPIRAGFTSNPNANPIYDQFGTLGTAMSRYTELTYDGTPPQEESEARPMYQALIGQVNVTDGILKVYIDDLPASTTGKSLDRSWYDGIGYEVVPEPATMALLGLGGLISLVRRKK